MGAEKRNRFWFLWIVLVGLLGVAALFSAVAVMRPDARWTWSGPPAGTSKSNAPDLSLEQRVRGRIEPGQTLYVRVPFAARGRGQYEVVGSGFFNVDKILVDGTRIRTVELEKPPFSLPTWIPTWLPYEPSWGSSGPLENVAYFVLRPTPGSSRGGAYEMAAVKLGESLTP